MYTHAHTQCALEQFSLQLAAFCTQGLFCFHHFNPYRSLDWTLRELYQPTEIIYSERKGKSSHQDVGLWGKELAMSHQ